MIVIKSHTPLSVINTMINSDSHEIKAYALQYLPFQWIKNDNLLNSEHISINLFEVEDLLSHPKIVLHQQYPHTNIIQIFNANVYHSRDDQDRRTLLHESKNHFIQCYYAKDTSLPNRIDIYFQKSFFYLAPKIILYIIRDILQYQCHADGGVMLHGSSVCNNGSSICFLADKGSGKTSWMLRMLKFGWDFIGNDRLFLFLHGEASGKIIPYPIAAMLSQENLYNLPNKIKRDLLKNRLSRQDFKKGSYEKYGLTPKELTKAFHCEYRSLGSLRKIFILCPTQEISTFSIKEIKGSAYDETLRNNIYSPKDPSYQFNWIARPYSQIFSKDYMGVIKNCVPLYELKFNWNYFDLSKDKHIFSNTLKN